MRIYKLFLIAFLVNLPLHSQIKQYQFTTEFNMNYYLNPKEAFEALNKAPMKGFTEEQSEKYRINTIYNVQQMFDNNEVYMGWYDIENYLYKILDTIIPPQTRKEHPFKIFLTRYPSPNAFAMDNGFIFVNIGLLTICRNEAQLAGILAHEVKHALGDHSYKKSKDKYYALSTNDGSFTYENMLNNYKLSRKYESESDEYGINALANAGYQPIAISKSFEVFEAMDRGQMHTLTKAQRYYFREFLKTWGTHPESKERVERMKKMAAKLPIHSKQYLVDSVMFQRLRKTAGEEVKKIYFESAQFSECTKACFIDYLYDSKNLKNLYMLIESVRKMIYLNPELKVKGFLTDEYEDREFSKSNQSILQIPELLFTDSIQKAELIKHKLFTEPFAFRTYPEAFLFFSNKALEHGLNEANLSQALFHYTNKDDAPDKYKESLQQYIEKGNGLYHDFAKSLLANQKPTTLGKKDLIIIDNLANFSKITGDPSVSDNYFLAIKKKEKYNSEIRKIFASDSIKSELVILNELLGKNPYLLYQIQKLTTLLKNLYTSEESETFLKVRLNKRESMEERTLGTRYTKHPLILSPEWYKWFNDNNIKSICLDDIYYEYKGMLNLEEFHNSYTICYVDLNGQRPYFKKAIRSGGKRKETTPEMIQDLQYFLYGTE